MDLTKKTLDLDAKRNPQATMIANKAKNKEIKLIEIFDEVSDNSEQFSDLLQEVSRSYEHLPDEFKKAMVGLKVLHNTPYDFSLSVLLGMANSCMQHLYDVDSNKYGVRPTTLFILILLGTGGSKSTIFSELKGPMVEYTDFMMDKLKNEDARHMTEHKIYKKKLEQYQKDLDSGLTPTPPNKPKPAETANYINNKFTVNGLIDILVSQPHASILSAEAGVFFSSHAFQSMKQDGARATEMTATLTTGWDGDPLTRAIKGERIVLYNRRFNLLGLLQAYIAQPIFSNKMFQEQGFIHRILISQIEAFDKPKMSLDPTDLAKEAAARKLIEPYLERLKRLIFQDPTLKQNKNFELDPIVIPSTNDALKHLIEYYNNTMDLGKTGKKLELYEGFSNRIHEHLIRIAATLAAFNNKAKVEITETDALCSIQIMNMFINHRAGMEMSIIDTNPDLSQGAKILEVWFKKREHKMFSLRELQRAGPQSFRDISTEQRKRLLVELLDGEKIIANEEIAQNGKTVQKYRYNND
jgi:hypothetical protein